MSIALWNEARCPWLCETRANVHVSMKLSQMFINLKGGEMFVTLWNEATRSQQNGNLWLFWNKKAQFCSQSPCFRNINQSAGMICIHKSKGRKQRYKIWPIFLSSFGWVDLQARVNTECSVLIHFCHWYFGQQSDSYSFVQIAQFAVYVRSR